MNRVPTFLFPTYRKKNLPKTTPKVIDAIITANMMIGSWLCCVYWLLYCSKNLPRLFVPIPDMKSKFSVRQFYILFIFPLSEVTLKPLSEVTLNSILYFIYFSAFRSDFEYFFNLINFWPKGSTNVLDVFVRLGFSVNNGK